MKIKLFKALRPASEYASHVASVPYDTVDQDEAAALASGNPMSFLHVTRAEIDMPPGTDPYDQSVYNKALESLTSLKNKGVMLQDPIPGLFAYRIASSDHVQTGVIACCHVDDYINNVIKKHENTRREKETDRVRLTSVLNAHTGPVLLTYDDQPDIDSIIADVEKSEPLYQVVESSGVEHTIWKIKNTDSLIDAFGRVAVAYIADGHHRAAAGARVALERRSGASDADEECNWFLAALFPAGKLRVLAYNRCIRDLRGIAPEVFLDITKEKFKVTPNAAEYPARAGHISMYFEGEWYDLDCGDVSDADPVAALDVSVLQSRLLDPVLGIRDPRTDKRIEYVSGANGAEALKKLVDSGKAAVAFSMYAVAVRQLMAIADAGGIMTPKSTWFAPKPFSGLLVHVF